MARKILLADDSVTAQNMGRKILADAGYEVITVNNGSAALKKIAEHKPDLIVLDVYMPGYSGLEVCQRLKEVPESARTPVLLTVGKLEPFKPEEAKRVRAEGYIVKPFEASELLSAISKLEDKIVPRAESSKPGRFARAIAAVEESNRSRNEAGDEDSGWKNRISFPSKKKKKEKEDEESKDSDFYNAVNRDLPTVVPREEAHAKEGAAKAHESPVDVAAVAPSALPKDALPKDVTPEEIAAIAAAAAQVQAAAKVFKETSEALKSAAQEEPRKQTNDENIGTKSQVAAELKAVEETPAATFAEHKSEAAVEKEKEEDRNEVPAASSQGEVVAAIAAAGSGNGKPWIASDSGNGAGHAAIQPADLPVTLVAAAAAAASSAGPRWTAVPVAMDAAEAVISLEQEMQKAQAALVAVEAPRAESAAASTVPDSVSSPAASEFAESMARVATHEESELAQALSTAANAAAGAIPVQASEPVPIGGAQVESLPSVPAQEPASAAQNSEPAQAQVEAAKVPEGAQAAEPSYTEPVTEREEDATTVRNEASSTPAQEVSSTSAREPQSAVPVSTEAEAAEQNEPAAGGIREMAAKKESDLSASTAAAWASWREIRNSGEPKSTESARLNRHDDDEDEATPAPDAAAMAVAAGAENSPEEPRPATDPRAIASIVDSVMAELRPKIVEEISRKLGEKK